MKRTLVSILAGSYTMLLIWLSGAELFERGSAAFLAGALVPMVALWVYCFPGWDE